MVKNYILIIFISLFYADLFAQDFQWVQKFEGSYFSGENANVIEVDSNENSYTFGKIFEPLFDLDPTVGTQIVDNTVGSSAPQCSLYLTKLDADGNFVWGKTFGTVYNAARVVDIEIGADGYIYLLADIREFTVFYQNFITIIKIDSQGNTIMTKKMGNIQNPSSYGDYQSSSLALDNQNNIYITGSYEFRLIIDPANPQLSFTSGGDSFLLKLDSNTGNILWGRKFDVRFNNDHYENVKIGIDQNPIVLVSNGDNQSYPEFGYNIHKIDAASGASTWQKFLAYQIPYTFNIDNLGNIVIAARHLGYNATADIDVDPGPGTYFISRVPHLLWLTSDAVFIEVKKYTPLNIFSYFKIRRIDFDTDNSTIVIGDFNYGLDADPSPNTHLLFYSCGLTTLISDAFYIKFDSSRNFDSAFKLGDYYNNCLNFYFTDFKIKNGNQYYVGNFSTTSDFDPSSNVAPLSPSSGPFGDHFTLKLGPCNSSTPVGNNTQDFCTGQNPTIGSLMPNSSSILWYDSPTATTQLNTTTPLINGNVYYASRQVGSCPASTTRLDVTVTINPTPAAPATSNQIFCANASATVSDLMATGQNIKWYASLTDPNSLPGTTLLQNNSDYYVSQTVNGCESSKSQVAVTINSVAPPTVISPQDFCIQQNAVLNDIVISGTNILWYDAPINGNQLPAATLLSNTTYYASQTINNCESSRTPIVVNIHDIPAPTGIINQSFCASESPTVNHLSAVGTNIIWYGSLAGTMPLPVTALLSSGNTYYGTQTISNCESVHRIAVTVNLINTLSAIDISQILCDDLNDGSEIINLENFNSSMIANVANCTFQYYVSLTGATNQETSATINPVDYTLNTSNQTIYVRITSDNGCHQIVKLNLALVSTPVINIPNTISLCERGFVTINAGAGFDSYLWSTGETSPSITVGDAGNYSITVTKNYGAVICSTTNDFNVVLSNIATITNIDVEDWTASENVIAVTVTGLGDYEFSIDGIQYQASNIFTGLPSGIYVIYVRDKNGCGIADKEIVLLTYPKFFTPNNDGQNDSWSIKFASYEPGLKVKIMDRYGAFLKELGHQQAWDGKINGQTLPSNDYWFVVQRANGKEYKGHFTLKR